MRKRSIIALLVLGAITKTVSAQSPRLVADASRVVRDSRGGGGHAYSMRSTILDETRKINIALPASFETSASTRKYPVMIVLDGEASLPPAAAAADELTRNGQIPEMIIVAIENTNRLRDLTPPGLSVSGSTTREGGDRFLDFIEKELLPEVDRQFRGAAPRTLIGHSSGGILATYAAATRSTYACIISLDAPTHLGDEWLARRLIDHAKTSHTALRYASYEARFNWSDANWKALIAAAPPTWRLHHEKVQGENHESLPFIGMYLGLREVFSDFSMLSAPSITTSIIPYYAKVGGSLGGTVMPPKRLLGQVIEDLAMEGRGKESRAAYEIYVSGYGTPAGAKDLLAQISEAESRPPMAETVEGLLATPFPTLEEARPYIGEWIGDVWMNVDELASGKPHSIIRISVVDGKVVGETETQMPGEKIVEKWTYMKITPTGMVFGYMNGMRPRGMLLHEGTMKNGTLSGIMRFGGINFVYPDGMKPPVIQFAYRRK